MMRFEIPQLETERLILRAPQQSDFAAFAAFYASPRAEFVGGPLSEEQAWRLMATELGHWPLKGYGRWIAVERASNQPVGNIGLWNPHGWPEAEIGWDLFEGCEGKGYATEAALAARSYAYDVLGWTTVISLINPKNTPSLKLAERLGARHDGDFTHERHGFMQVWRHLSPDEIENGGMEAYA